MRSRCPGLFLGKASFKFYRPRFPSTVIDFMRLSFQGWLLGLS